MIKCTSKKVENSLKDFCDLKKVEMVDTITIILDGKDESAHHMNSPYLKGYLKVALNLTGFETLYFESVTDRSDRENLVKMPILTDQNICTRYFEKRLVKVVKNSNAVTEKPKVKKPVISLDDIDNIPVVKTVTKKTVERISAVAESNNNFGESEILEAVTKVMMNQDFINMLAEALKKPVK